MRRICLTYNTYYNTYLYEAFLYNTVSYTMNAHKEHFKIIIRKRKQRSRLFWVG